jgi:hypothetical protein
MSWLQFVLTFAGGGIGTKLVELLAYRDQDSAKLRAELFKIVENQQIEIAQLRARVEACERRWAEKDVAAAAKASGA